MTMTDHEIVDLLSVITAYDHRKTGAAELNTWAEAARRGRWTYELALDAVHQHFANSTAWLMPGHITQLIRAQRQQPEPQRALPGVPAHSEHMQRTAEWLADQFAADRETKTERRRSALRVECPTCTAEPGQPCWQTTGRTPRKNRPPIESPHYLRTKSAGQETA